MNVITVQGYHNSVNAPNLVCVNGLLQALAAIPDVTVTAAGDVMHEEFPNVDWKRHPIFALRRIKKWPAINPDGAVACYWDVKEKVQRSNYDVMIAFHCPYEAVDAAVRVKKECPSIKLVLFEIDPITNDINTGIGIGKRLNFLRERAEKLAFNYSDLIIHMEGNRKHFMSPKYGKYLEKTLFLDLPLIADTAEQKNNNQLDAKNCRNTNEYRLIFSGRLSSLYRSPNYLLEVLRYVAHRFLLRVDFFAKGDCDNLLHQFSKDNPFLQVHSYIPPDTLETELDNSDFLINIGNRMSDMVPSKLFTYFLHGKPIIHVSSQKEDICLSYLDKYGLYLNLCEEDSVQESGKKMIRFIKDYNGERIEPRQVIENFEHNTTAWNARRIIEEIYRL